MAQSTQRAHSACARIAATQGNRGKAEPALLREALREVERVLIVGGTAVVLLLRAAKAQAVLEGRSFVLPEDVQEMWAPCLRHRVMLDPALEVEGQTSDGALERTLRGVTVPR